MALEVMTAAERRIHATDAGPGPAVVPAEHDFEVRAAITDERPPLAELSRKLDLLVSPMSATRLPRSGRLSTMNCDRRTP